VWTGIRLHASHNLWIQGFFDVVTVDSGLTRWFTTEFGAALAVTGAVTGYLFRRLRDRLPPGVSRSGPLTGDPGTASFRSPE